MIHYTNTTFYSALKFIFPFNEQQKKTYWTNAKNNEKQIKLNQFLSVNGIVNKKQKRK